MAQCCPRGSGKARRNGRERGQMHLRSRLFRRGAAFAAALVLLPPWHNGAAQAQPPAVSLPELSLPTVQVIAASPVLGSGIDRDKLPASLHSLTDRDIANQGAPDLPGTLERRLSSVNITDVEGSPFQPSVQFRGFQASPIVGTPQGLAVYQNGIRINEAFGDAVNWDLIPEVAIDRLDLVSNNPVFGLNAIGGALALQMKNGFTYQGFEGEVHGGSFGRRAGSLQYGVKSGNFASYVSGEALNEEGWRDKSPSQLRRFYADLGGKDEDTELHLNISAAANRFGATAATPIELLDLRREAVYTTPQVFQNDLVSIALTGMHRLTDTLSLQGNLYYRGFRQHAIDGNAAEIAACDPDDAPGTLCLGETGGVLFNTAGAPIPTSAVGGAVAGTVDRTRINSDGFGGAVQVTDTAELFGRGNHLVAGLAYDGAITGFTSSSELGAIGPDLSVTGTGIVISQPDGEIAPSRIRATNNYYGLYATDTFDLTSRLAVTASGRFNYAEIRIEDRIGIALNGDNRYRRFNPAIGATYKVTPDVTAYAGYSEANRAPTPSELGCADPARPCLLANFVVSDPPLKQVVAHSAEAGLRGGFDLGPDSGRVTWNFGLFRSDLDDDIIISATPASVRGFFQNAGETRRQGVETAVSYRADRWFLHAAYSYVDATFQSSLTLPSPNNPAAVNGLISVKPGDRLPSIPQHRFRAGAEYTLPPDWKFGADLIVAGSQFLRGDESNQNPKLPGYAVVNLHASYQLAANIELFGNIQNLLDEKYATFGTFFDPTRIPFLGLGNPRTLTPAPPLAIFAGIRVRL